MPIVVYTLLKNSFPTTKPCTTHHIDKTLSDTNRIHNQSEATFPGKLYNAFTFGRLAGVTGATIAWPGSTLLSICRAA